ncbi:MAG TPA: GNAT family N-acetyltransferase [Ardenticatenaceae bacterium]|jgi:GNAT superfamily N-acetyltransferase
MVQYRLAQPEDEEALLDLWVAANPGTTREAWRRDYHRVPALRERVHVAIAPGGSLLAAAAFWPREVRDARGAALKVGDLSHVATRPEARRQGHARRLVELTIEAMREEGCVWSSLTTSEEARTLYEALGWRAFPRPVREGIASAQAGSSGAFSVSRYEPASEPEGWDALARVYDAFNAARPLTVARDAAYWRDFFVPHLTAWLSGHAPVILVARRAGQADVRGYAIVYYSDEEPARAFGLDRLFTVSELGIFPGDEEAVSALLAAALSESGGRLLGGRVYAPREPEIDAAIEQLFGQSARQDQDSEPMARVIAPDFEQSDLDALFAAPGAMAWPLDDV